MRTIASILRKTVKYKDQLGTIKTNKEKNIKIQESPRRRKSTIIKKISEKLRKAKHNQTTSKIYYHFTAFFDTRQQK